MATKETYRINGKQVTKKQWDRHFAKRKAIYGDPFEEMIREGKPPTINTNDTFMRGKRDQNCDQGLDEGSLAVHKELARRRGISLEGKHFYSKLANSPTDLEAWCGSDSEVIAKAKKNKELVELPGGRVYDFREKYRDIEPKKYAVDERVVEEQTAFAEDELGPLSPAERKQLKEQVRRDITPANL